MRLDILDFKLVRKQISQSCVSVLWGDWTHEQQMTDWYCKKCSSSNLTSVIIIINHMFIWSSAFSSTLFLSMDGYVALKKSCLSWPAEDSHGSAFCLLLCLILQFTSSDWYFWFGDLSINSHLSYIYIFFINKANCSLLCQPVVIMQLCCMKKSLWHFDDDIFCENKNLDFCCEMP